MMTNCSFSSSPSISEFITSHPPLTILETRCTNMRHLHQIHTQIIKTGLAKDRFAVSRLLNFCTTSPSGDLNYALLLFSHTTTTPTSFMWNSLLRALANTSTPHLAISLFRHMLRSPTRPQNLTYPSLFSAYAQLFMPREGAQLHGLVLKCGLHSDPYVRNSIISMYNTCGCLTEACRLFDERQSFDLVTYNSMIVGLAKKGLVDECVSLFDEMPFKNLVTWNSMLSAYTRNGKNGEALALFRQMQSQGIEPDIYTMVTLLGACASLGALEQGEWIHAYIDKNKLKAPNLVIVTNAIIDMYCKCGSIKKAMEAFENATVKGVSTWNAMVSGLAIHGHGREAVRLFSKLESSTDHLRPDSVSFLSILTACNHCGLVNEARHYLSIMSEVYGIKPGIEHYGCLVDVLGRAGRIKEAEALIHRMPMKADVIIWGSLLSACRNYGEMEVGKRAAARIMELDPRDSGGYVMLSSGHARDGEFDDAMNARRAMKRRGVRKEPGCSVIVVNGGVHEFVAGGMLHPQATQICQALNGLHRSMRRMFEMDVMLD